jgi:ketosteroid isomerase-like protein
MDNNEIVEQVKTVEEELRIAIIASDVVVLERLLADDLVFTSHTGQVVKKADDLSAHKSGIFKIKKIAPSEQDIRCIKEDIVIVTVKVYIEAEFDGNIDKSNLRYTRIWQLNSSIGWQIVAGHASVVQ